MTLRAWLLTTVLALGGCGLMASSDSKPAPEPQPEPKGRIASCECAGATSLGQGHFIRHCQCGALNCALLYENRVQPDAAIQDDTDTDRVAARFAPRAENMSIQCR
jgi:hypothetical protein